MKKTRKGFTILELLVVIAVIAVLATIAIPKFIGMIEKSRAAAELAEVNTVQKAVHLYYIENSNYPTIQGDVNPLQTQPIPGSPHNIQFEKLYQGYITSLPHFSYWWIDSNGIVYHTQDNIGTISARGTENVSFTPTANVVYIIKNAAGVEGEPSTIPTTTNIPLIDGTIIIPLATDGTRLPFLSKEFLNVSNHSQSISYAGEESVGDTMALTSEIVGNTLKLLATAGYRNGTTDTVGIYDEDFIASNILSGKNIFGLTGTLETQSELLGNADVSQVLSGSTFYSDNPGELLTGLMPNRAGDTVAVSSSVSDTTLKLKASEGYRDGTNDTVTITDPHFNAANVRNNIDIFGITGSYVRPDMNAGDLEIHYQSDTQTNKSTAYIRQYSYTIYFSGTVRLTFYMKTSNAAGTAYAKWYRNGSPVGITHSTSTTSNTGMTQDISGLSSGDKLDLYLKSSSTSHTTSAINVYIKGDYTPVVTN